jgi:hypothetical protein
MPEKVFDCGHAICNTCVRRFGQESSEGHYDFSMDCCILCGLIQPTLKTTFRLTPPTAGIRVLCVDGGGVRGVIPLTFLQHLEQEIKFLGCNIQDMFDYVCGTSAGKTLGPMSNANSS